MNKQTFQIVIKYLLNVFIALVTLIIGFSLVAHTQLLLQYQPDFEYSKDYFSYLLPVELLCIFFAYSCFS